MSRKKLIILNVLVYHMYAMLWVGSMLPTWADQFCRWWMPARSTTVRITVDLRVLHDPLPNEWTALTIVTFKGAAIVYSAVVAEFQSVAATTYEHQQRVDRAVRRRSMAPELVLWAPIARIYPELPRPREFEWQPFGPEQWGTYRYNDFCVWVRRYGLCRYPWVAPLNQNDW